MTHESEWLERADVYALGALDPEERVRFEAHLAAGCAPCEARIIETREALTALPEGLAPIPPPPAGRARLLDAIAREATPERRGSVPSGTRLGWWAVAGGAVAAAGLLVTLGVQLSATREELARLHSRVGALQGELAERRAELARQEATLRLLADPAARPVNLTGLAPSPAASAWLWWSPATRTGLLMVRGLPPAPQGRAYEVWALAGTEPVPAGVFTVDATGRGLLQLPVLPEARTYDRFAVTLEPAGGVPAPTGPMYLLGSL
jgi:anti-sigma-K factor RskA